MDLVLTRTVELLAVAILVAIIARRMHLPYTVGLVVSGLLLSPFQTGDGVALTHDFIFDVMLPPLLFEAALSIHWDKFRKDLVPVLVLATLGVVINAFVVALGMTVGLGWPLETAVIFGVLLAATDPVSVIALFKDLAIEGRLRLLVEGESLLNDGVAAVLFGFVLTWAEHHGQGSQSLLPLATSLATSVVGGIAVGLGVSALAIVIAGRTSDHLVETTLTTVAAYGAFLLAERFGLSGVLATVTAGLLMGNVGVLRAFDNDTISARGREFVVSFWDFAAFVANSIIFLVIGMTVAQTSFARVGLGSLAVAVVLTLLGRALTVYPLCGLFARSRWAISIGEQHVLWWGGLRGALGLALVLALPGDLPMRDDLVIATFGVVTFSVLVQGLTMPRLLRFLCYAGRRPPDRNVLQTSDKLTP